VVRRPKCEVDHLPSSTAEDENMWKFEVLMTITVEMTALWIVILYTLVGPTSAEVKKKWVYRSTPPYVFIA
jgi:hypothetical protein